MITEKMDGADAVNKMLGKLPMALRNKFIQTMKQGGQEVKGQAMDNLSGLVLNPLTGDLRGRVSARTEISEKGIVERIGIFGGRELPYGRAHERGAVVRNGFGKGILIRMPARRWLGSALDRSQKKILQLFRDRFQRAVTEIKRA